MKEYISDIKLSDDGINLILTTEDENKQVISTRSCFFSLEEINKYFGKLSSIAKKNNETDENRNNTEL